MIVTTGNYVENLAHNKLFYLSLNYNLHRLLPGKVVSGKQHRLASSRVLSILCRRRRRRWNLRAQAEPSMPALSNHFTI